MRRMIIDQDIKPMSEFRSSVSSFVKQVHDTKRPLVITQHGKGVAVLTDISAFEAMQTRLALLDDIYKAETQIKEGNGIAHSDAKSMVMRRLKV